MNIAVTIPVVYQNDKLENLKVTLDILEHLENVSLFILERISQKVQSNCSKLQVIERRTFVASEKVKSLVGRKQAITIISPQEYPSSNVDTHNYSLYYTPERKLSFHPKKVITGDEKEEIKIISPLKSYERSISRVKTSLEEEKEGKDITKQKLFGLGKIPNSLESVTNLLLFNTDDHCYKTYPQNADPLLGRDVADLPIEQQMNIDPPPNSLLKEEFLELDVRSVNFKPVARQLPQFTLPSQLELPDIIDIPWNSSFDGIQSIAPSSVLNNLPKVQADAGIDAQKLDGSSGGLAPPPPMINDMLTPPPPPPPPSSLIPPTLPSNVHLLPSTATSGDNNNNNFGDAVNSNPNGQQTMQQQQGSLPQSTNSHNDLLSSIVNFDKSQLGLNKRNRPVNNTRQPKKEQSKATKSSGDMIGDLKRLITTRRLALEGRKTMPDKEELNESNNNGGIGGVEEKISSPLQMKTSPSAGESTPATGGNNSVAKPLQQQQSKSSIINLKPKTADDWDAEDKDEMSE